MKKNVFALKWEQVDAESLKLRCLCSVCQHGMFQCVFHPCPSMCMAYGDRHYRTFDGLLFDYVGACKVYLVKVLKVFNHTKRPETLVLHILNH